jgi:exopolysaccharide biosynthesis polyprenyl glycosylphosphotransferase
MLRDDKTGLYNSEYFDELLTLEMRRCERTKEPVLLMLTDLSRIEDDTQRSAAAKTIVEALVPITRDTDMKGWSVDQRVIGVLFTGLSGIEDGLRSRVHQIMYKCSRQLSSVLGKEGYFQIDVKWEVFPQELANVVSHNNSTDGSAALVVPRLRRQSHIGLFVKRLLDIVGSMMAVIFFAPLLGAIALFVKLTSEGPVFFRQERIGLEGKPFMLLKFRSMYVNNDPTIHKDYVRNLISGGGNGDAAYGATEHKGKYKIQNDPRITNIGKILRKTSLDELPQFLNVLNGEMSLVGPRPPIEYECEHYELWHRHRILDMKPGITGLWQVTGRSTTSFDDMVRLDLKYIREWSIWLDIRILLKTPLVVFSGTGAY